MEVIPPAPPIDAEMAEDAAMASQAAIDSMEYDEEAPRYDEAGDVEINDAQQDDARSTEMGEEDARDYATLANAAALQQEFAASSASSSMAPTYSGALVEVEAPMLPVASSDGMQASQAAVDEQLETQAGYEPVEADAPEQSAQIVEVQDEADAQPGQAGDTAQGEAATEPSAVDINHAAVEQVDEPSTSALPAAPTSSEQHDEAQAEPEAPAEDHATTNEDEQVNGEASAATAAEQQASAIEAPHDHAAESSTAAGHSADAPLAKEGNGDSAGYPIASTSSSSPSSPHTNTITPPPTLRLTFEEESFVLFPSSSESSQYLAYPSDGTDGPIESVDAIPLSVPTEVYWEPLEALFKGLRVKEALGEFLEGGAGAGAAAGAGKEGATAAAATTGSVASDLVLRLPDLGLVVREDSVYTREVRLVDLVRLHEGLGAQSSLHIEVSEDDSFLHELRGLQEHVKENARALANVENGDDDTHDDGPQTGEATIDGQQLVEQEEGEGEEAAGLDAGQGDAQQDEAGADAAEQTFVTVGEGREDDDDDAGEPAEDDHDDTAGHAVAEGDAQQEGADEAADAEAEAEPEAEEPSYEPVEDGEVEDDDAPEEQGEVEEKLVEYEEEEDGADVEGDKQHQDDGADADQYEEEGDHDQDGEGEHGEEQQHEEGDYPEEEEEEEEEEAEAEEVEEGYDEEEEAVDGHAEDDAAESAAAGAEIDGNDNGNASEAPARLGKRSFDGEDELDGDDNGALNGESGVEAKKVKASH